MLSIPEKLEKYSIPVTESGCQIWIGATVAGYGVLQIGGKVKYAHRLSWEARNGPIPNKLFVCHRCDIRPCINPDHLFLGTDLENIADMVAKGRHHPPTPRYALNKSDALLAKMMTGSYRSIARKFHVSHATISKIKAADEIHDRDVRGYVFVNPGNQLTER